MCGRKEDGGENRFLSGYLKASVWINQMLGIAHGIFGDCDIKYLVSYLADARANLFRWTFRDIGTMVLRGPGTHKLSKSKSARSSYIHQVRTIITHTSIHGALLVPEGC